MHYLTDVSFDHRSSMHKRIKCHCSPKEDPTDGVVLFAPENCASRVSDATGLGATLFPAEAVCVRCCMRATKSVSCE